MACSENNLGTTWEYSSHVDIRHRASRLQKIDSRTGFDRKAALQSATITRVTQSPSANSSYSDVSRLVTGVDIRSHDANFDYLLIPAGGQIRSAYSQVEGLDHWGDKSSGIGSSREIENSSPIHPLGNQTQSAEDDDAISSKCQSSMRTFEKYKTWFSKRSTHKAESRTGKRIGFYRILMDIGRGNFSKVKLATHTPLNTEVAVKVIDRSKFDARTRKLLAQEFSNMELLDHPHILQIFEYHEQRHRLYLIMEYAPAGEMHSYLKRHGRMEEGVARNITAQIVSALNHMHNRNVVHRDLKAENVLFVAQHFVKIADFGFSKLVTPGQHLTTFCGSPPYAAPELFKANYYIGPGVDMWALGVLIFYMITGFLPFRGDSIGKIKRLVISAAYRIPDHVSSSCGGLITGLLRPLISERLNIEDVKRTAWFETEDWFARALGFRASSEKIDDKMTRELLKRWWTVDDVELNEALTKGPSNALTGIYRIVRNHGVRFLGHETPPNLRQEKKTKKRKESKTVQVKEERSKTKKKVDKNNTIVKATEVTMVNLKESFENVPPSSKSTSHSRNCVLS